MTAPAIYSKIKAHHIDRLAIVYVRQSTPGQLVRNPVSKERQLALRHVAVNNGWAEENVIIVDCDQGISAAWGHERKGFDYIVDEVANGNVGAIFCLEVSRLSREDSEFSHLIRLCIWTKTLLGDEKNIYDPNIPEDKLVLNVRGITSSFELHFITDRLQGARRLLMAQAKYRFPLPTGYVYNSNKKVVFDPREGVQESIRLFFDTFERLGSAMAVVRYFKANGLKFPTKIREGERKGELKWDQLTYPRAIYLLHDPTYAGTYTGGRSEWRTEVDPNPPYKPKRKSVKLKRSEWKYVKHDVYSAYISWEQFLRNEQILESNRNLPGEDRWGVPRAGLGILQGLAFCGKCNARMRVSYPNSSRYQYYLCCRESNKFGERLCQSFRGKFIDKAVEELFLQAFRPACLELAVKVYQEAEQQQSRVNAQWKSRIRQAETDLKKIEGRYDFAADHKDTRMAHRLAKEFDAKQADIIRLKRDFSDSLRLEPSSLSQEDCRAILELDHALPDIWRSEAITQEERKHLLRLVIEKVILVREALTVNILVRWKSGACSTLTVKLPARAYNLKTIPEIIHLIRTLGVDHTNQEIADYLNRAGYRNKQGGEFNKKRVQKLRYRYRFHEQLDGEIVETEEKLYSMNATARLLGVNVITVRNWRQKGFLECMQEEPGGPWLIKLDPSRIRELHTEIGLKKGRLQRERYEQLRREVTEAYEKGGVSIRELAKNYEVSVAFICSVRRQLRKTGSLAYKPRRQSAVNEEVIRLIKRTLKKQPKIQILVLQDIIKNKLGVLVSKGVLSRALTNLGFPRKPIPPKPVFALKKVS